MTDAQIKKLMAAAEAGDEEAILGITREITGGKSADDGVLPPSEEEAPKKVARKATPKGDKSTKKKPTVAGPKPRKAGTSKRETKPKAESREDLVATTDDFMFKTDRGPAEGRTWTDDDGVVHKVGRLVPLRNGEKFVNKFKDDGKVDPNIAKVDKALKKMPRQARPGEAGADRDVAKKTKIRCTDCKEQFEVYPSEIGRVADEDGRRMLPYYKCARCLKGGR